MSNSVRFVVVVGFDFSDEGDLALRRAFELALERAGSEIHVVDVVRSFESGVALELPSQLGFTTVSLAEASRRVEEHVERRVEELTRTVEARERSSAIRRVVSHVRLDAPAEQIVALAFDLDADLVVVGTHGRRGLSRMMMGSVAEAVVRRAPCPVLVVREKRGREHGESVEGPSGAPT